jgi:hypothetical protein
MKPSSSPLVRLLTLVTVEVLSSGMILSLANPLTLKTDTVCSSTVFKFYSASHSRLAPENVGLQKEQKCNTFACRTCNEVRLCVLGIRKKEVGNTKR